MAYRVFLSHNSRDRIPCERIRKEGRRIGVTVYMYEFDRRPGTNLSEKIRGEIRNSDAVIVLLTKASARSAYVHQEIGYAEGMEKPIIPVVENVIRESDLAMLKGREFIQYDADHPQEALLQLLPYLDGLRAAKAYKAGASLVVLVGLVVWLLVELFSVDRKPGSAPGPQETAENLRALPGIIDRSKKEKR